MWFLQQVPGLSGWAQALLDGLLLTTVLSPVLYFLFFRPFKQHILKQEFSKSTLRLTMQKLRKERDFTRDLINALPGTFYL